MGRLHRWPSSEAIVPLGERRAACAPLIGGEAEVQVPERTAEQVQHEIETARDSLATAVDQLAARTSPKRLAGDAKQSLIEKAQSPGGKAVLGGLGAVIVLLVVRRVRMGRKSSD